MRRLRVAVLASGRGSNLKALLAHIRAGHVDAEVTLVASDRAEAPVLDLARRAKVAVVAAVSREPGESAAAHDKRLAGVLLAEAPDLVVLAGYLRIVGPRVLAPFTGRVVNIHPSLLPSYPGLRAVQQAVRGGARLAGCTTHIVTEALDGGPILLQAALAVRDGESEQELGARILRLEHLLLPRTVQLFAEGRIRLEGDRATIAPGPSWLERPGIELAAGALYGEGF